MGQIPQRLMRFEMQEVLDKGHVKLMDLMGDDEAIVQMARTSYEDEAQLFRSGTGLIRHLMREWHTSPFERCELVVGIKMPIFVARQLVRHRTACLAGDVELSFDLPSGKAGTGNPRRYPLTVQQVFARWQPTRGEQGDPLFKRRRIEAMQLRCLNEDTKELTYTRITDIWSNGNKVVWEVEFDDGSLLRATLDHQCFTDEGWLSLRDAIERKVRFAGCGKGAVPERKAQPFTPKELAAEEWRKVSLEGFDPDRYEVSNLGRVRSRSVRGARCEGEVRSPRLKKLTNQGGSVVVGLSAHGRTTVHLVHHLVLGAFVEPKPEGMECRHLDDCPQNNRLENICWGTAKENHDDRMANGGGQNLSMAWRDVKEVKCLGEMETFDLSVTGPYHNFHAGGVFVHNSMNEVSARYSVLPEEFYEPPAERMLGQGVVNRQGSNDSIVEAAEDMVSWLGKGCKAGFESYSGAMDGGVAREVARISMPVAAYTKIVWKIDLHNLLHFLRLRLDPHAQQEIRVYAEAISNIVKAWVPVTWKAFVDYRLESFTLSRMALESLRESIGVDDIAASLESFIGGMARRGCSVNETVLATLRLFGDEVHAPLVNAAWVKKEFLKARGRLHGGKVIE